MNRRDALWIICFLVLGGLGLTCYIQLYDRASPAASLNFQLDRDQALETAESYLQNLGYDLADYQSAQVFSRSSLSQTFLERTIGLAKTNRLIRDWLSVWYWRVRWFKPLQKEELRVSLDPAGRIVSFSHSILESDEGASLSQGEARVIAEIFLTDVQNFQLTDYEPIEASSNERPDRMDHTFTYRKKDFVVGDDGHYRLSVTVKGDKVGYFGEYLKIPETFSRSYREIRSRANTLYNIANIFSTILLIAMVVLLVRKYRQGTLRWHATIIVGIVVAATNFLANINGYPLQRFGFDTTQSFSSFLLTFIFSSFMGALAGGVAITLSGTAGGAAAQDVPGWRNPLARLSLRGWRSTSFARTTLIGYGLAFAHLGYLTLFYIFGNEYLGVWSPATMTEYSNTYSTFLPWIYPLLIGLVAATSEEFLFRLLAIALLMRWLKKTWLAVLIPAIVWAFLHANYPQEPIYIRGLELTIVGIIWGFIFLKFGVWTTTTAHYVYNCFLGIYPMVQSDSTYFQVSGILAVAIIFIPAIPAIFSLITGRYQEVEEPEDELDEQLQTPETEPSAPKPQISLDPDRKTPSDYLIAHKPLIILAILGAIGWTAYYTVSIPGYARYARKHIITRDQAIQKAEEIRQQFGIELDGYQRVAVFSSSVGSSHFTHLIRNTDVSRADTLVAEHTASWRWRVRWFKALKKEELSIYIDGQGNLSRVSHPVPESQEGAELSTEEAEKIANTFLSEHLKRDVTDTTLYKRLEARSRKRENRMDYNFVWERTDIKVEEGEFRTIASIQGDKIGSAYTYYKAPEEFLRKLRERTAKHTVTRILSTVVMVITTVLAVIYFLRAYRDGQVSWRLPVYLGILVGLTTAIEKFNDLVIFYSNYSTSVAMNTFLIDKIRGIVMSLVTPTLMSVVMFAFGETLYRQVRPKEMQVGDWIDFLRLKVINTQLWWQSVLLFFAYWGITRGVGRITSYFRHLYFQAYFTAGGGVPPGINSYLPSLEELVEQIESLLVAPLVLISLLFVWWRTLRQTQWVVMGVMLFLIFRSVISPTQDFHHAGLLLAVNLPGWAITGFFIWKYVRFNFLFYIIMLWTTIINDGVRYLRYDIISFQVHGTLMILFGFIPVFLAIVAWYKQRGTA